jgi:hypothetical protein
MLIRLPLIASRENYLAGFWRFVELLAEDRYDAALAGLWREHGGPNDPDQFRQRIETFFGGDQPWSVVIPNERLVGEINRAAEVMLPDEFEAQATGRAHGHSADEPGGMGWMLGLIPVTNQPDKAKDDDVVLMGVAASFFLVRQQGSYVMRFEIFHA